MNGVAFDQAAWAFNFDKCVQGILAHFRPHDVAESARSYNLMCGQFRD